ncbi:hypothetical protein GWK48_03310 [Metallosphaera tengchongensis]|uniref:Nucleotide exchange factor GrpE n=1 Tax=Metallosphaera tengchongensis TaxID=1532350 RepID=A0A6N0NWN6_9CREN|nr:hypothetical protein [Metallosphaera tengchongensis]QKQ99549.1 hypothetical protein GWK48_03310 [Metallosphaera tengchongensis]
MKLRIDKLPKTDEDLAEIQREVESSHEHHEHNHEHHGENDLESVLGELYVNYQSLEAKVKELEEERDLYRKEVATLYKVLSKVISLVTTENNDDKKKILAEILSVLDNEFR